MSHSKSKNKSNDPKEIREIDEIATNANENSSLNNQMKRNDLSSSASGEDYKRMDKDPKAMKFRQIMSKIESQTKKDAKNNIIPILESLVKLGNCVQKRDLRFELLEKFVRHLQECDAKGVMEVSTITRGMVTSDKLKKLIVDDTSISESSVIAVGTLSLITLGHLKKPGGKKKRVAIKTVDISIEKYLINEAEVMAHLDHVNIVKILAFQKSHTDKLIVEYFELGDLTEFIKTHRHIDLRQYLKFLHDIATGMEYITAKNYIHGDLACRNVFVTQSFQCKIGDFGCSHYVGDSDGIHEITNREYPAILGRLSPQSRTSGRIKLSWKTDVWSMGVLIWDMFFELELKECILGKLFLEQYLSGFRSELPNIGKCPRSLYAYNTSKIMNNNPNKRPTFTMIKNKISEMLES